MTCLQPDNPWKLAIGILVLVIFAFVGIAGLINPDWFIRQSGLRQGGEMLTGQNRFGCRMSAAAFTGFAVYVLYVIVRDLITK